MIRIKDLAVQVGDFRLERLSLEVPTGQYAVLMGKTGSGKTTILECLCGLRAIRSGKIFLGDRDVTNLRPAERGVGYVPQDGALFTTMTVQQHLEFPLRIRRWPARKVAKRTAELAALLHIEHLMDRRPFGLSGGEAQRVALGRALSFSPSTIVLDEPLSALDDNTREQMYILLNEVQQHTGVTALHITHSRGEVTQLADLLLLLENGRVRHVDPASSSKWNGIEEPEDTYWS